MNGCLALTFCLSMQSDSYYILILILNAQVMGIQYNAIFSLNSVAVVFCTAVAEVQLNSSQIQKSVVLFGTSYVRM